LIAAGIFVK